MFKFAKICAVFSVILMFTLCCGLNNPSNAAAKNSSKTVVYYFYGKPRCVTCKNIEAYTKKAVAELKNPKVELVLIDMDKPANEHYKKEYGLFTKSVVLSKVQNGKQTKWKNLPDIWTKIKNEKVFKDYIKKEIKSF